MVRTTERRMFAQCRQRWWWTFVECLQPIDAAAPLKFGDIVHQALALYYKPGKRRGPHPAKSFIQVLDEQFEDFGFKDSNGIWTEARDLGVEMLTNYVDRWGKDSHIEVISPEMPAEVDVYNSKGKYVCTYVLKFDAVIRDLNNGQLGLFEHKTAKAISTSHLPLDEQGGTYWTFATPWLRAQGILGPSDEIKFILYNFLRKGKKDDRPTNEHGQALNKNGSVSKNQPSKLFLRQPIYRSEHDRESTLSRVRAQSWEMGKARQGKLPIYKNPAGQFPDQHCNTCAFRDMCELHETGGDWETIRDLTMTHWEPYADHVDIDTMEEEE
jgi:hypothetical protein